MPVVFQSNPPFVGWTSFLYVHQHCTHSRVTGDSWWASCMPLHSVSHWVLVKEESRLLKRLCQWGEDRYNLTIASVPATTWVWLLGLHTVLFSLLFVLQTVQGPHRAHRKKTAAHTSFLVRAIVSSLFKNQLFFFLNQLLQSHQFLSSNLGFLVCFPAF